MNENDLTGKFLEILNFVVEDRGYAFEAESPVATILNPDVIDPETFLGCLADAKGCEVSEINQVAIMPETDTVRDMCARVAETRQLATD